MARVFHASARTDGWVRSRVEAGYVATVAILAVIATNDPNQKVLWAFIASLVLCLPSMIAVVPVFYVAVSTAFNITGADNGGSTWPVTATYVAVFVLAAVLNVLLVELVRRSRQRRRAAVSVP